MVVLTAAVIVVGVLCLFDLVLTFGVIRRLREHTELLAKRPAESDGVTVIRGAGTTVGAFAATATDGSALATPGVWSGDTLVGFFSPHCGTCVERLPGFVEVARQMPGGAGSVLAVAVGTPEETRDLRERLEPVARVVVEADGGPVSSAFRVDGFPAFALVDKESVVVASGYDLARLPVPAAA